jgi:hypothetical protein
LEITTARLQGRALPTNVYCLRISGMLIMYPKFEGAIKLTSPLPPPPSLPPRASLELVTHQASVAPQPLCTAHAAVAGQRYNSGLKLYKVLLTGRFEILDAWVPRRGRTCRTFTHSITHGRGRSPGATLLHELWSWQA